MQFLNPLWLVAIAAISIPVIIHLWNIKTGKRLKVGSIALVYSAAQKSSRSFKLNYVLLLLIRLLFLILLAFLLAVPIWHYFQRPPTEKSWLLIPKENVTESYKRFKPVVDSLLKAGYQFHYFDVGFETADLNKILNAPVSVNKSTTIIPDYWNLITQLNEKVDREFSVYIISPNQMRYFAGSKPTVSMQLHWLTFTPADSVSTWINNAWFTNNNDIKVISGSSKPSATVYTSTFIHSVSDADAKFTVNVSNGKALVYLKNESSERLNIDTSTLRIAIYTRKYAVDAAYVNAALKAISNFTGHKTVIKQYADSKEIPAKQNWLFWLSDEAIDSLNIKKSFTVFSYEHGKEQITNSWLKTNGPYSVSGQSASIALYKTINQTATTAKPLWTDGYGNPVLTYTRDHYCLYTHFNPAWNDLPWSNEFPKLMMNLLYPEYAENTISVHDRRIISGGQYMPNLFLNKKLPTSNKEKLTTSLSRYLWLALIFLFFIDRVLSTKNKLTLKND